jgi:hypothetical protein
MAAYIAPPTILYADPLQQDFFRMSGKRRTSAMVIGSKGNAT